MIIGVILTIFLLFLIPVVLRWMKVPQYDIYVPKNVFSRAGELVNKLFNLGDIIKESQQKSQINGQIFDDTSSSSDVNLPQPINSDTYNL